MNYAIGEIILVPIPFSDLTSRKVRPAIIVGHGDNTNDLMVVPITSQSSNIDLALNDWRNSGLNVPWGAKAQIATIDSGIIVRRVGKLSARDKTQVPKGIEDFAQRINTLRRLFIHQRQVRGAKSPFFIAEITRIRCSLLRHPKRNAGMYLQSTDISRKKLSTGFRFLCTFFFEASDCDRTL
jgi:mRNA interferase MazF